MSLSTPKKLSSDTAIGKPYLKQDRSNKVWQKHRRSLSKKTLPRIKKLSYKTSKYASPAYIPKEDILAKNIEKIRTTSVHYYRNSNGEITTAGGETFSGKQIQFRAEALNHIFHGGANGIIASTKKDHEAGVKLVEKIYNRSPIFREAMDAYSIRVRKGEKETIELHLLPSTPDSVGSDPKNASAYRDSTYKGSRTRTVVQIAVNTSNTRHPKGYSRITLNLETKKLEQTTIILKAGALAHKLGHILFSTKDPLNFNTKEWIETGKDILGLPERFRNTVVSEYYFSGRSTLSNNENPAVIHKLYQSNPQWQNSITIDEEMVELLKQQDIDPHSLMVTKLELLATIASAGKYKGPKLDSNKLPFMRFSGYYPEK